MEYRPLSIVRSWNRALSGIKPFPKNPFNFNTQEYYLDVIETEVEAW